MRYAYLHETTRNRRAGGAEIAHVLVREGADENVPQGNASAAYFTTFATAILPFGVVGCCQSALKPSPRMWASLCIHA
ncbi:hypothetical protein Krac_10102 [Ktedonobacter racemifer DSM 44963]|uniref:Uncharacterized protein n=1 Tax=Ktedonobacter racemifer DSM 44963 TaxID=485913 RepID=D6TFE4_KTERA|nr:hypothetical protein Krac_10102 [Ktedonobacter racemifer DSM 44963]